MTTSDGRYAFVDLVGGGVLVYSVAGFVPRLIRTIRVPDEAVGCSLTRDGRLLLIANGRGATVVSVARAERGAPHPVLGTLSPPRSARLQAAGAIETASSASGRYVFVSLEYGAPGGVIAVYDLGPAPAPRFGARDYVGAITLGSAVVGSALSPDGRYLYVTSEVARQSPAQVRATTARASDRLLAFSTARLLSEPARALLAAVKVGTAPVGVAVFDHGKRVTVADSNRFNAPGSHAAVTIVNTTAVLAHRAAAVATLRAGQFPRELAVERDDSVVLVSNFASDQLGAVNVSRLR